MAKHIVPDNNNDGSNLGLDNQRWSGANLQTLNVGGNKINAPFVRYLPNVTHKGGNVGDTTGFGNTPTIGEPINSLYAFTEASSGQLLFFRLVAGQANEGMSDTQIPPGDYNQNTNQVFFKEVQPFLPFNTSQYSSVITDNVGTQANFLSAIVGPTQGQIVQYLNGDNLLVSYIFIFGDGTTTNDPLQVRDNGNTGCWYQIYNFDVQGDDNDVQFMDFPNGVGAKYLALAPNGSIGGQGCSIYLGGGKLGNTQYMSSTNSALIISARYIRFHGLATNATQSLPPIGAGDGSHVLVGAECFLWNDDATYNVTVTINGGPILMQPGDRMYLRAAIQAGQQGMSADYWDYSLTTALGRNVASSNSAVTTRSLLGAAPALTITAPKTGTYAAAANEFVTVDLTGGNLTVALPTVPKDGTVVGVKIIAQPGTNVCTIASSGGDVFTKAGGTTTETLKLLNEAMIVQYKAATALWTIISNDSPLGSLDLRFASITGLPGRFTVGTQAWAASEPINFNGLAFYTIALTGATTFTSLNLVPGGTVTLRLQAAANQTLAFPAGWTFLGATAPTQILAGKTALLSLTSFGTTDVDVVAAYAVQP